MAKTTPPADAAPALDQKAVSEMIEKALQAKAADQDEKITKAVEAAAQVVTQRVKRWVRREIGLNASGATDDEREDMNR